jgi:hypothetical protein
MVKHFILFLLFAVVSYSTIAQDTSAYEIQRSKVNTLLAERSAKFGQYDQSLNAKTGIFGFQTKRDIQNSNEILRQIALTDNDIFKELKILLDYKDLQVQQVQTAVSYNTENLLNYRRTIKQLQDQNQVLSNEAKQLEHESVFLYLLIIIFVMASATFGYFLWKRNQLLKSYEKRPI